MNTNTDKIIYKELSFKIIGLAMQVHNELGHGFVEKVYENAMMILFRKEGIRAEQQRPMSVHFQGQPVGEFYTDIIVEHKIILELKAAESLVEAHRLQTLNYLKASGLRLTILINFGKEKLEYERLVL